MSTVSEQHAFFTKLASVSKPSVLSIVPEFSDAYIPVKATGLPPPLTDLYDDSMLDASFTALLNKCDDVFDTITITEEEARLLEEKTRDQSKSKDWFLYRAGRITASKFKAAARTDVSQPSLSLIRSICYPESHRFSSAATAWGCEHESVARDTYVAGCKGSHRNFSVKDSGLFVPTSHPYLGASPDDLVSCDCCGCGVIEVKCPFTCRNKDFSEAAESANFCLEKHAGGFRLKTDHAYFYQVQAQMFATKVKYCDFVVWQDEKCVVLRILTDPAFTESMIAAVTSFFKLGVLPELVGKWFSKTFTVLPDPSSTICTCMEEKDSPIVECARAECSIRHNHLHCLRLKTVPKKTWYCPACRKIRSQASAAS